MHGPCTCILSQQGRYMRPPPAAALAHCAGGLLHRHRRAVPAQGGARGRWRRKRWRQGGGGAGAGPGECWGASEQSCMWLTGKNVPCVARVFFLLSGGSCLHRLSASARPARRRCWRATSTSSTSSASRWRVGIFFLYLSVSERMLSGALQAHPAGVCGHFAFSSAVS